MSGVNEAKKRALQAHKAACVDSLRSVAYDRWLAHTLSAVKGKDPVIAATMFTRLAIALEVVADMRGWPDGVVAGLTVPRRASRIHAGG